MDLTVRDWMVIVGVLLVLAVFLDAYRRVRADKRAKVRVSMEKQVADDPLMDDDAVLWPKELPNGGARVVDRSDILRATTQHREEASAEHAQNSDSSKVADEVETESDEVELVTGMSSLEEQEDLDWLEPVSTTDAHDPEPLEPAGKERLPRSVDPEVFMVNVVSRDANGFRGEDILHILLACDLRFGDMSFFHRHEEEAGRGPIQFSVANMVQPGVFDLDNMAEMMTPGLVFFLSLPGPENMMQAFDYMLETAQAVARNLGGDVLDETRSVMTRQTLEHSRQQIRDLERRMLSPAPR